MPANVSDLRTPEGAELVSFGSRPLVNNRGQTFVRTKGGLIVNSALRKDEWEELDQAVVDAARDRLNIVSDLRSSGLTKTHNTIGVLLSQYNQSSEMTRANVSLSGKARTDRDRVDFDLVGIPLPIISKEYEIGERELQAARRMGDVVDTTNAAAASRVVAEELERMVFDGYQSINLNGNQINGLKNHPDVNTGSASGDWGTISNIIPTVRDMINDAQNAKYFGPYRLYVYKTQFNEANLNYFTDGSGDTPLNRIRGLEGIQAVRPTDWLSDGEMILVHWSRDVIDLAMVTGWMQSNMEWTSNDGMSNVFKVATVAVPRVKSDHAGNSGVVYYTGA